MMLLLSFFCVSSQMRACLKSIKLCARIWHTNVLPNYYNTEYTSPIYCTTKAHKLFFPAISLQMHCCVFGSYCVSVHQMLMVFGAISLCGAIASIWNVSQFWSLYSIGQGLQVCVNYTLTRCIARAILQRQYIYYF